MPLDEETGCTELEMSPDVDLCPIREKLFKRFAERRSSFLDSLADHDRTCGLCIVLRGQEVLESLREQRAELRRARDRKSRKRRKLESRVACSFETWIRLELAVAALEAR